MIFDAGATAATNFDAVENGLMEDGNDLVEGYNASLVIVASSLPYIQVLMFYHKQHPLPVPSLP